ncbi:FAD-dependent oxidoreductase [Temperatibacter marinus]|uniref:FAD-dependent oxidoreductase n=1 Tax=Temperatibacter marinus TaxID=1456591 RepID=A0AA52EDG7_9PROT|nr:FAD-dependent oxidoreductase [Temperatibacter marinus]WND02761.1 FAD-dependent oxidoreductase [Temperatibacter marinus]
MADIVIIGGGHAAAQLVTSLKQQKFDGSIVLISDENELPYQRPPLSKAYLKGEMTRERLVINRQKLYEDMNVDLKLNCRAEKIDREAKSVLLADGSTIPYGSLILATGGHARQLEVPGCDKTGLHYVRKIADIDAMHASWDKAEKIVIIGGGYIGLEIAAVARGAEKSVTLLEAEDRLLKRVTAPTVSEFYHAVHSSKGVDIQLNKIATAFEGDDCIRSVVTQDGARLEADLVIIGIGLIANSELADAAGLETNQAGIVVNAQCQTSDSDIYAVGDVTWHHNPFYDRHMRLESVQNAVDQAKVAIQHICGHDVSYNAQPWFWSDQYELKLQMVGLNQGYDEIIERGSREEGKLAFFYLKEGRMIAADCISSMAEFMQSKKLIAARVPVTADSLQDPRPFKEVATDLLG